MSYTIPKFLVMMMSHTMAFNSPRAVRISGAPKIACKSLHFLKKIYALVTYSFNLIANLKEVLLHCLQYTQN